MSTKFKWTEKTTTILLYVGAAILVVAILSISIFAFVSQSRKNKVTDPTSSEPAASTAAPTTTQAPVTQQTPNTEVNTPTTTTPTTPGNTKPTSTEYQSPVQGAVAKGFDMEQLVYSVTMNDYRVHSGIDLEAPVGTPVYAMADGQVLKVYNDYLMGTCLEIDHGNGLVSCYMNLQEVLPEGIKAGAKVTAGQLIGGVGETAIVEQSDEAHLHFEIRKNGVQQDPAEYIKTKSDS